MKVSWKEQAANECNLSMLQEEKSKVITMRQKTSIGQRPRGNQLMTIALESRMGGKQMASRPIVMLFD